jgi:hypothetical protein
MIPARWLLVLVPSTLTWAAPRVAQACSQEACSAATFTPAEGATVPVNAPGLFWSPLTDRLTNAAPDPAQVSLVRAAEPATRLPFAARAMTDRRAFLLVPDAPLTIGETYVVADAAVCSTYGASSTATRFIVGPAAPLPTALGALGASEQVIKTLSVPTYTGSCTSDVTAAQRAITLDLDPAAAPWAELLEIQTLVDDRVYLASAELIRSSVDNKPVGARVRLHRTCATGDGGADPGLTAGAHTVRMRATLAGTTTEVASTTLSIALDCKTASEPPVDHDPPVDTEDPPAETSDGGCNASGGGSLAWLGLALGALVITRGITRGRRARR